VDGNEALLESWELSLHDKARGTVRLYVKSLRWFADWLAAHGKPDLLAAGRTEIEGWFNDQRAAGLKATTRRSRWIALRSFYNWAHDEDEIDSNPMLRVKVDRPDPAPIPTLSTDELRALLRATAGKDFQARRDHAIIRLAISTGLRLSEIADLKLEDVDLVNRLVIVHHGKGDRKRVVRCDPQTAAALDRYKRIRGRHAHAELPWLWVARLGRFTHKGIPIMLTRRAKQAGLTGVHAHQFRHTWADRWLANGGTEGDLQKLGGWESSDVMRRYGSARAVDRALSAYDQINPTGDL
jgi:integrase/recombinase XerD